MATKSRFYLRWKRHHPEFVFQNYARWISDRGYYQLALDTAKPEFYEYATVYLGLNMQRPAVPHPGHAARHVHAGFTGSRCSEYSPQGIRT
jgi:hypothetical protein